MTTNPSSKQVDPELKGDAPCPWCAQPPEVHNKNSLGIRYLGCPTRGCTGRDLHFVIDHLWNTRVPVASTAPGVDQQAWLIEKMLNGNVHYISANYMLEWTDDPNKALRLARREDAEALCTIVEDADKIASHEWVPAAAPPRKGQQQRLLSELTAVKTKI